MGCHGRKLCIVWAPCDAPPGDSPCAGTQRRRALEGTLSFLMAPSLPRGAHLGTALFLVSGLSWPCACLCLGAWQLFTVPDLLWCCLGFPSPTSDAVSDAGEVVGRAGASCPLCCRGKGRVWLVPGELQYGSLLPLPPLMGPSHRDESKRKKTS